MTPSLFFDNLSLSLAQIALPISLQNLCSDRVRRIKSTFEPKCKNHTFCCSAALNRAMRSSSARRFAAILASAASSRASRSASSLSVLAKFSRVFFILLLVSGRRLIFSRLSMRPKTADTRRVEMSTCDVGGRARERITCFALLAETTPGRTRGWSVICGM